MTTISDVARKQGVGVDTRMRVLHDSRHQLMRFDPAPTRHRACLLLDSLRGSDPPSAEQHELPLELVQRSTTAPV